MFLRHWDTIIGYLREKPYWSKIQPILLLGYLYIASAVLGYQYIQWQYRISPTISLYIKSYLFKQITVVFVALVFVGFILTYQGKRREVSERGILGRISRERAFAVLKSLAIISIALAVILPILVHLSPSDVSHIRVQLFQEPEPAFDRDALVYLLYELNRLQKDWYFEMDFRIFNENALTSTERERCKGQDKSLCYAEIIAGDKAFIAITTEGLGEAFFWQNRDKVSVISTFGWQEYAPPSTYDYLAYSMIIQSILIQLNAHCEGLPDSAFKARNVAYGDLFQFLPRRRAIKASILAAHLSPNGEELLLNCFGANYMSVCSKLLTLEWLHSEKVIGNLRKSFGVTL